MIEPSRIAAVLLAAGQSRRFGAEDKLLAQINGEPVALRAAHAIRALSPLACIAVCPDRDALLADTLARAGFQIVENDQPGLGMSRSLALGIAAAAQTPCDAALLCLGDMPFVTEEHLRALLERFHPESAPVVASTNGAALMPPALFHRARFSRLLEMAGDSGGKALLAGAARVIAPAGTLRDIDVAEDISPFRRDIGE